MKKVRELRDMTDEELRQRLADTRQELFELRMKKSVAQIEKPVRIRTLRRDVARMLTLMNERHTT